MDNNKKIGVRLPSALLAGGGKVSLSISNCLYEFIKIKYQHVCSTGLSYNHYTWEEIKADKKRRSIRLIGEKTMTNINPDTGMIITACRPGEKLKGRCTRGDNEEV